MIQSVSQRHTPPEDEVTHRTGGQTAGARPGTPRWVKALALGAAIVVLIVVIVMLLAGGEHGPGRHGASVDPVRPTVDARYA